MSTEKYPWPQHQLTALVLGELEPEVAAQIQTAADNDPTLATEIAEIRVMVDQLGQLYKHETIGIEPTTYAAATATQFAGEPVVTAPPRRGRMSRTAAAGLLAMAASLLIAFTLAAPTLKTYFVEADDVLARVTQEKQYARTEANSALEKQFEEAAVALSREQAARKSSTTTSSTPSSAMGNRDGDQFGDVQVEQIDEIDLVIVRGGEKDVERTMEAIMKVKESEEQVKLSVAQDASGAVAESKPGVEQPASKPQEEELKEVSETRQLRTELLERMPTSGGMPGDAEEDAFVDALNDVDRPAADAQVSREYFLKRMPERMQSSSGGMPGNSNSGGSTSLSSILPGQSVAASDELRSLSKGRISADGEPDSQRGVELARRFRSGFGLHPEPETADRFEPIHENQFTKVGEQPLSTFSIDVDTASYVKARQFLLQSRRLPPANAVRTEEFINYFEYEYAGPKGDDPFNADLAVTDCPWRPEHKLVRIALQAKKIEVADRPKANIVFLLDVSGSMDEPNKLPLVKESMRMLIQQLGENDRVAMVVYAGAAGCVLESTTGDQQDLILGALDRLNAGGSTNGGQGIQLAYDLARDHFVPGGINRVILCTDGDFNVGVTSTEALVNLVAENAKSKIFLTVLGFGMGNSNDAMMEQISNKGNGVYGFVDSRREAQRQMVKQLAGNLMTVAKDVKIQVEFNPTHVASYRLIGYENRVMAAEDFNNDKKDAGEIGAGHRVTALYEIEPVGTARDENALPQIDDLRYQKKQEVVTEPIAPQENDETSNELLAVKLRYKQPEGDTSKLLTFPLVDESQKFADADRDFQWAAVVAQFAMLLRNSQHKGTATWSSLQELADRAAGVSPESTRQECLDMIRVAAGLQR